MRMKGLGWDIYMIVSVVFLGVTLLSVATYIRGGYIEYDVNLGKEEFSIYYVETAHAVEMCLEKVSYGSLFGDPDAVPLTEWYMDWDALEGVSGLDITSLCGFKTPKNHETLKATLVDAESGKKVSFSSEVTNPLHSIWVNFRSGGETRIGRLHVGK